MPGTGEAALLERERETDALRAAFARARAGDGTLVLRRAAYMPRSILPPPNGPLKAT